MTQVEFRRDNWLTQPTFGSNADDSFMISDSNRAYHGRKGNDNFFIQNAQVNYTFVAGGQGLDTVTLPKPREAYTIIPINSDGETYYSVFDLETRRPVVSFKEGGVERFAFHAGGGGSLTTDQFLTLEAARNARQGDALRVLDDGTIQTSGDLLLNYLAVPVTLNGTTHYTLFHRNIDRPMVTFEASDAPHFIIDNSRVPFAEIKRQLIDNA